MPGLPREKFLRGNLFPGTSQGAGSVEPGQAFWFCGICGIAGSVAAGTYTVYVEATLRRENRVLYSGKVTVGGSENAAAVSTEYFGTGTAEREMISGVKAVYRP